MFDPLETFFRKLEGRDTVTEDDKRAMRSRVGSAGTFRAGSDLVRERDRPDRSTLLVSGFSVRYRVLKQGQRQITAIHMPGDFVDLHSFLLKEMDHSVGALTECGVVTFPHKDLAEITEEYPHLTRLLWLTTLLDGAIHREWLVGMGRRTSSQQIAHLVCELYERLKVVGLAQNLEFRLPITQTQLGDMLGMSPVHVNRVLQELRAEELFSWDNQRILIFEWERLAQRAEFDPRYLHLKHEPR